VIRVWPLIERTAISTTATMRTMPMTSQGNIFALAPRPMPNAVRRLCS
jgi:hypothetical protein